MGAAVAVPAIIQGASAIGGMLLGRKATKGMDQPTAAENQFAQPAFAGAKQLQSTGSDFLRSAGTKLNQSGDYFGRILSGNRAELNQSFLPETNNINEMYRGAKRGLFNMRGGSREKQEAELNRQKLSQLGTMIGGARGNAATALGSMGMGQAQIGAGAEEAGGNLMGNLLRGQQGRTQAAQQEAGSTGESMGSLLFNVMKNINFKGAGKAPGAGTGVVGPSMNAASPLAIQKAFGGIKFGTA